MTKESSNSKRVVFRLQVPETTVKQIEDWCYTTGITQIATTSRLVVWFDKQSSDLQSRILGIHGEEERRRTGEYVLRRFASGQA